MALHAFSRVLLCGVLAGCASGETAPVDPKVLIGTWKVDLRPTPGAPDYYKQLVVASVSGNSFEGKFYDTPLSQGHVNVAWGTVRIAFDTEDRSGPYHHSAVLNGSVLEGLSNSTGRAFLAYWSAVKE